MSNRRLFILLILALSLGALFWFDQNQSVSDQRSEANRDANVGERQGQNSKAAELDAERILAEAANAGVLNPLATVELNTLDQTIKRPIFSPERGAPPPVVKPKVAAKVPQRVKPKPAPLSYQLLGVVRDNNRAIALLRNKKNRRDVRVETGDVISGWKITRIDGNSVALKRAGKTKVLRLIKEPR